ncbi:DUF6443 domain-containing protein [Flavobacterium microcysteis]
MIKKTSKIFKACLLLAFTSAPAIAQTTTQNYTRTTVYREAGNGRPIVSITYYDGLGRPIQQRAHQMSGSGKDVVTHIEYDASGRQAKEFLPFVSPSPTLDYNPAAATDVLSFYGSPSPSLTGNPAFEATGNPYTEKLFETSPLGRSLKQAAPGNTWKMPSSAADPDHTLRTEYLSNSVEDGVKLYKAVNSAYSGGYYPVTLSQQGTYPAGALSKTLLKDENWTAGNNHATHEFMNKEGQIVLKRTWGFSIVNNVPVKGWHDTYYVYDDMGNLAFVLPPLSDGSGSQADLNGLCYQYRYDEHKRPVEKKLPGKQWEFIIYDNLNRVIATGPVLSPFSDITGSGWQFTKYDVYGRVAYTGWMSATVTSTDRNTLQTARNAQTTNLSEAKTTSDNSVGGVTFRYTNTAWPTGSGWHVLSVNYYDNYDFAGAPAGFSDVEGQPVYYNLTVKPKGLSTGLWNRVMEASTATAGELSYILYDHKARPIRTRTKNFLGGYTQTDSKLDFSGKVLYTITEHKRTDADSPLTVREDFAYTAQDRLLSRTHKIGNNPAELLSMNSYDELGQLISKKVGSSDLTGNSAFQKVDYSYTVRGWLKGINDTGALAKPGDPLDLFAFRLYYDSPIAAQPLYNGNIAEAGWKTASDDKHRRYSYTYDTMNRLTNAVYIKETLMTGSYNESAKYDKNGNIISLQRNGGLDSDTGNYIQIDDLTYAYELQNKNRLKYVEDGTDDPQGFKEISSEPTEYFYDANGNMIADLNKGISDIRYNHLNLPTKILFGSETRKIQYLYTSEGKKVRRGISSQDLSEIGSVDYLDGFQYSNGKLQFFSTSEGYVRATDVNGTIAYSYVYNYTDHLGNIRLSYAQDPASPIELKILEENHYYPFGLKHTNYNSDRLVHKEYRGALGIKDPGNPQPFIPVLPYNYKYNGKELQEELGLNLYDYGNRNYDPAIGRFMNMDRFAEKYYHVNPYQYGANNPVVYNDIKGDSIYIFSAEDNALVKYESGKLYSKNAKSGKWEPYKGKNAKIDKNGNISIGGFLGQVVAALDRIRTGGPDGNQLVGDLQNAPKSIRISQGSNASFGIEGVVIWDPSNTTGGPNQSGNKSRPAYIGLSHELGHVHDGLDGVINFTKLGERGGQKVALSEIYAMDWENKIRSENNEPLRLYYDTGDNGRPIGEMYQQVTMPSSVQLQVDYSSPGGIQLVPVSTTSTILVPIKKF